MKQEIYGAEVYERKEHQQSERMLMHLKPYLDDPKFLLKQKIALSASDEKLSIPQLQHKLITALIQYVVATDGNTTLRGLANHFEIKSSKLLSRLISKAYSNDLSPEYPGKSINRLRKEVGADYSYLEEVMKKYNLDIGTKAITMDIRIPDTIDENVARAVGWLSTAPYIDTYKIHKGHKIEMGKNFSMSFKTHDEHFIQYEVLPFFGHYHNYTPYSGKMKTKKFHGSNATGYNIQIGSRPIVSFYKNIGIIPDIERRRILFDEPNKRKLFLAGVFDILGSVRNNLGYPTLVIHTNSKFSTLLKELQEEFGKGNESIAERQINPTHQIYLASGGALLDFVKQYPLSNPRLLYPVEYYRYYGKYPDMVSL